MFGKKKQSAAWIRRTHLLRADEYECSVCGSRYKRPSVKCPNCGRIMRGSKHDPSWVDEAEILDIWEE